MTLIVSSPSTLRKSAEAEMLRLQQIFVDDVIAQMKAYMVKFPNRLCRYEISIPTSGSVPDIEAVAKEMEGAGWKINLTPTRLTIKEPDESL